MHAMQVLAAAAGRQVVPARAQMATTLGFHIILACFGIAFPTIVLVAEYRGLRRSDDVAMLLARRWSQVLGVLVAVGAVTGTVLSFEMGLLWHGRIVAVDPWQVFFNRASLYETPHMILAAYMVVGFMVASVYAAGILKGHRDRYHRLGFGIPFTIGAILTPVQIFVGDTAARAIASEQPVKFAAIEYVTRTGRGVAEYLGGFYVNGKVYFGLRIPDADSLLVGFSPHTRVIGLNSAAPADRPPALTLIHLSFDAMVGLAFLLLLAGLWALLVWRRRRGLPRQTSFWWLGILCSPAALAAMECGWIVYEVGRQPWVVYELMTTSQAATTNGGVIDSLDR